MTEWEIDLKPVRRPGGPGDAEFGPGGLAGVGGQHLLADIRERVIAMSQTVDQILTRLEAIERRLGLDPQSADQDLGTLAAQRMRAARAARRAALAEQFEPNPAEAANDSAEPG
jgi:hypothetical protein